MTAAPRGPRARRLLAALGASAAVGSIFGAVATLSILRVGEAERAARLQRAFERLLHDAQSTAGRALAGPGLDAAAPRGAIGGRLEGVAVLGPDLDILDWRGSPAQPPAGFADRDAPPWSVRVDGLSTRLFARAGPDSSGRLGLAVFVLDSAASGATFRALFPDSLVRGLRFTLREAEPGPPPPREAIELRTPAGETLVLAEAGSVDRGALVKRAWGQALALALCVLLALLALAFDWAPACRTLARWSSVAGAIVVARVGLWWIEAPDRLLPPAWGEARIFGTTVGAGFLASPADLLLTGAALWLICLASRSCLDAAADRRGAVAVAVATCAAALGAGWMLLEPLVRDSRLSLLDRRALDLGDPRPVLIVGLALVLIGAAELIVALALRAARADGRLSPPWKRAALVAAVVTLLSMAAAARISATATDLAVERLREELAPLALQQEPRRRLALTEALEHVADSFTSTEQHDSCATASAPAYLAFRFWAASSLASGGFKSSLDFYDTSGDRVSHFAFDLPRLAETVEPGLVPATPTLHAEAYEPVVAVEESLLHAEVAVRRGDELVGVVVGHVLDEPTNLPFLPGSQPYLTALGAGPPAASAIGGAEPQYVLYDAEGAVLLTTLRRPPPHGAVLRAAREPQDRLRVEAGTEPHVGIALPQNGRLHLLLVAQPTWLERLAAGARLAIAALLVMAAHGLALAACRTRAWPALASHLRRSLYRKLLAALLVTAILPLGLLGLILREYIERRGEAARVDAAARSASVAQRVLEDYLATRGDADAELSDDILYWLRRLVGQEIHVYRAANLVATSKRELFASGLVPPRIDGSVYRSLHDEGLPYVVRDTVLGSSSIPVAYAPLRVPDARRDLVVAVPVVLEPRQIARAIDRVADVILLASVVLLALLALSAAFVARSVAGPVRELAAATTRIAGGDYGIRLEPRTRDEVAELVWGFNSMAEALARQRADLERRREYIERLLQHAPTGVLSTDAEGRLVSINPAARALLEPADPSPGADLAAVIRAEPALAALAGSLDSACASAREEIDVERNGKSRRYRIERIELPEPEGPPGTLLLLDDLTEAARGQRLEAWAEMARAIAHEIKNPLTPIRLSADHLRRILADRGVLPAPEIEACLDTMLRQVRALHEIAGEFSAYAKLPALAPEPLDPAQLMRDTIAPYRAAPPPGVRIEESYASSLRAAIDRRVLARALVNLVENALQAMPGGGTLEACVAAGPGSDELTLGVSDTGTGITSEARRRLFEPYFSTKSSGTGLGLAIARGAVEAHGGRIEVDSVPGQGTTVRVVLPRLAR